MNNPDIVLSGIRPPGYTPEVELKPQGLTIVRTYDFSEYLSRLRQVTLLNEVIPGFHPLRLSTVTLEAVSLDKLHPCALYVLRSQLTITRRLREAFLTQEIDILNLDKKRTIIDYHWGEQQNCIIAPPLVEISQDDGGIWIVVDGLHRVTTAKELGLATITVAKVENTAASIPALPVSWDEVKYCDAVPPTELRRKFRFNSPLEVRKWIQDNYDRFLQGFDFPEKLGWLHGVNHF